MAKTLAIISDGSKPLKNNMHERYARFRAQALPRIVAFRKAGNTAKNDNIADANSVRLEKKPGVRQRIEYLVSLAQDRIAEKRAALEISGRFGRRTKPQRPVKTGNWRPIR